MLAHSDAAFVLASTRVAALRCGQRLFNLASHLRERHVQCITQRQHSGQSRASLTEFQERNVSAVESCRIRQGVLGEPPRYAQLPKHFAKNTVLSRHREHGIGATIFLALTIVIIRLLSEIYMCQRPTHVLGVRPETRTDQIWVDLRQQHRLLRE